MPPDDFDQGDNDATSKLIKLISFENSTLKERTKDLQKQLNTIIEESYK